MGFSRQEYWSGVPSSSPAAVVADLQYALKGIQGKDQDEALSALGKLEELALKEVFSGETFMDLVSCTLSCSCRKVLKLLNKMPVPQEDCLLF